MDTSPVALVISLLLLLIFILVVGFFAWRKSKFYYMTRYRGTFGKGIVFRRRK